MDGFDNPGLFYHDRFFADDGHEGDQTEGGQDLIGEYQRAKTTFRSFLREFAPKKLHYIYREKLRRQYMLGQYHLDVNADDLRSYDQHVYELLHNTPNFYVPALEAAAKDVADELTRPRPVGQEQMQDVQVTLNSNDQTSVIRDLHSGQVSKVVKLEGIIIAASQVRSKATKMAIQCRNCGHTRTDIDLRPGFDGYALPRQCASAQAAMGGERCPIDPYHMMPDKCRCVDFQVLKLQENPENVPHGEMPRHMQLYADRYLTDTVAPGNRVSIVGVYSIKKTFDKPKDNNRGTVGVRAPYIRVLGMQVHSSGAGRAQLNRFTPQEEDAFRAFAARPDVYDCVCKSVAPSIFGSDDIKKAVALLLFGGSRKRMPDGLTRRGDINVLLLGDPGTAKSQLLKFVEKCAPISVYTSGKGSSAAGLTASVIRDPSSRNFIMEGGAMVLADGGVVCIDEFDKMREDDRVAIHEAMEQQTISIAKAGITTTLNSRCSVLAAANSVFGRWDDAKGVDNIDFMPTILSRFDAIFVVKDEHDDKRDTHLAKHVIRLHMNAGATANNNAASTEPDISDNGELSLSFLKRYVAFCRATCAPRVGDSAGAKLVGSYVRMRNPAEQSAETKHNKSAVPITVRQLEALVRMSEAMAKMNLRPRVNEQDVDEALRIFRVSTQTAAQTGSLAGVEGFTSERDQESFERIEKQIKKRFPIGTQVTEHVITQDFVRQNYNQAIVHKVLAAMIRRGQIQHRLQRKMLFRVK